MTSDLPSTLSYLERMQNGMFSRRQALQSGLTSDLIKGRMRRGAWRSVYPGVYTTTSGELLRKSMLWAAVLYAGRGAVLSHETAAELHDLADRPSAEIHVSIPGMRKVSAVLGVRIHRSASGLRAPSVDDGPPCTNVTETVLDLVAAAQTFDDVCGWVSRAISRELTDEQRLRAAMTRRGRLRWRADLDPLIAAALSGDHSVLELLYTRKVERPHGLPEPDRQVSFTSSDGRRGRRDRVYAQFGVVVELDGRLAHRAEDSWRDKERDNAAVEAGMEPLRYGWRHVRQYACATAVQVAKILGAHGWTERPEPCSVYCPVLREFPS